MADKINQKRVYLVNAIISLLIVMLTLPLYKKLLEYKSGKTVPSIVTLDMKRLSRNYAKTTQKFHFTKAQLETHAVQFSALLSRWISNQKSRGIVVLVKPAVLTPERDLTEEAWSMLIGNLQSEMHGAPHTKDKFQVMK